MIAFSLLLAAPVDHSAFDALLRAHVTEEGFVDYDAFARSDEFRSYLARLAETSLEGQPEPERLAFWIAAGRVLTLDEVEHEIIRRDFREPRIHFALVCAALSCPPLRREAYVGARLDEQLDDQARGFLLRSPGKNRVDAATGTVFVSPILVWYRDDFGGSNPALGRFLARYFPAGPEKELLLSERFRLRETRYDWTLNSVERGRARR